MTKTRIIFFGNERLVSGLEKTNAPILNGLIDRGYDIVAIVAHHSSSKSRNLRDLEVAGLAERNNIPLFTPDKPSEIINELQELSADIAVLAAYGRIISQRVIDIFPKGIINIHPSLLPKYRGPTPIESAILHGDTQTGVSIMRLTAGMDEGPVYAQQAVDLEGDETKFSLYSKIDAISTSLFFDVFPRIIDGSLQPETQKPKEVSYSQLINKTDGIVDWNKDAVQLERNIRAYLGWPQSRAHIGKVDVIITKAQVAKKEQAEPGRVVIENSRLFIGTGQDWLEIIMLKPLGKKEMPVGAFLSGYRAQIDA